MDELVGALDRTADGLQGVVLSGEPGVGKSRVIAEFCRLAHDRGARVLYGRCEHDAGAPYQAFAQAVRPLAGDARGQAAIAWLFGPAEQPAEAAPPPLPKVGDRIRRIDAAVEVLFGTSQSTPTVLAVEDLHWIDEGSLLAFARVAQRLTDAPLLMLGTYRSGVPGGDAGPFGGRLTELVATGAVREIELGGLDEAGVATLVEAVRGEAPSNDVVAHLHQATAGNPLFVVEMLRSAPPGRLTAEALGADPRGGLTQVREVISARVATLAPSVSDALTVAAVMGREFSQSSLDAVTGLGESALKVGMAAAAESGMVRPSPAREGEFAFRHALIREALYDGLDEARRAQLHLKVADVLERNAPENLTAVAHHLLSAGAVGDLTRAVDRSMEAGRRAMAMLAYEDAAGIYERARTALDAAEEWHTERRCDVLLTLGDANWKAGRFDRAREAYRAAADLAMEIGAPARLARAALGMGGPFTSAGEVDDELILTLEEALDALDEWDSPLRARVLGKLADALTFSGSQDEKRRLAHEAVVMARRVGEAEALSDVLRNTTWAMWHSDDLEERLAMTQEIAALAIQCGESATAAQAYGWRTAACLESGDAEKAEEAFQAICRLADELREPYVLWAAGLQRARRALMAGELDEGEALAQEALAMGHETPNAAQGFGVQLLTIRWSQGRLGELAPAVEGFAARYPRIFAWQCAKSWVLAEAGRLDEAAALLREAARGEFSQLPNDMFRLTGLTVAGEAARIVGDVEVAATIKRELLPYADRCLVPAAIPAVCLGSISRTIGMMACMLGDTDAAQHLERAAKLNRQIGAVALVAQTEALLTAIA